MTPYERETQRRLLYMPVQIANRRSSTAKKREAEAKAAYYARFVLPFRGARAELEAYDLARVEARDAKAAASLALAEYRVAVAALK